MSKKKEIVIKDYIRYWSDGTPDGQEIRIAHGDFKDSDLLIIKLKWPDRSRDKDGRVTTQWQNGKK